MNKWDKHRGNIFSKKGGWTIGKGIITHGYNLLDDIHGKCSMFQVMILNITGRLPERRLADLVEGMYITLSWPDARIWCNKMGVFNAMTHSSITTAIAAGGLAGDSKMYGAGTGKSIGPFFEKAYKDIVQQGVSVETFIETNCYKNGKFIAPGFARPLAKGDERIPAMRNLAKKLGYEVGPYSQMVDDMETFLNNKAGEGLNLSGFFSAFMLDQGFTMDEIMGIAAFSVTGGVYAAYFEYINQPPNIFLALRVDDIDYIGPKLRNTKKRT